MIRCVLLTLCSVVTVQALTTSQLQSIKGQLETLIRTPDADNELSLVAATVRLSFHDCVGGCDGCVDLDHDDNAGLETIVADLNNLYEDDSNGISALISRADLYALAGIVGAEVGASLQRRCGRGCVNPVPTITFRYGRTDCDPDTVAPRTFPSGIANHTATLAFFQEEFNFNNQEVVALMGAHTLGEAHSDNSGFRGRWVPRKDSLDNDYFVKLADAGGIPWEQTSLRRGRSYQWNGDDADGRGHMMLNSDMVLYHLISPDANTGESQTCSSDASQCPYASDTKDFVDQYAANNAAWMADFSSVFEKMIEHGATNLQTPSA